MFNPNNKIAVIFIVIFSFCSKLDAQEILFESDIKVTKFSVFDGNTEDIYPIYNNKTKNLSLFILGSRGLQIFRFDADFSVIADYTIKPQDMLSSIMHGSFNYDTGHCLFFSDYGKDNFFTLTVDFESKKVNIDPIDFKPKNELFLQSISHNNEFYILTLDKKSSNLNVYEFDKTKVSRKEKIDLSNYNFDVNNDLTLYDCLIQKNGMLKKRLEIQKIELNNPNTLEVTANESKIYPRDKSIVITLDFIHSNRTSILKINTDDFSHSFNVYKHDLEGYLDKYDVATNSYLFENTLYQISSDKEMLKYSIMNLDADNIAATYEYKLNEEIEFKNTELLQDGGITLFTSELENEVLTSDKFFKRLYKSNLGITVYERDSSLEVTVGGSKVIERSGGSGGFGGSGMIIPGSTISTPQGSFTTPATFYHNPTFYGFDRYKNSRSVYFVSLVNKNDFQHLNGAIEKNVFDKIELFSEKEKISLSSKTIFKIDGNHILGYYDKKSKKYYLLKFFD